MTVPISQLRNDRQPPLDDWLAHSPRPAVYSGGSLYELPVPVTALRVRDAWDFERLKVPLADGDTLSGHSQQGAEIVLEGKIASQGGEQKETEQEMFAELEQLRSVLDVNADGPKYSLFLVHDADAEYYRKFKSCSTVKFEFDLSNRVLYAYSVVIHAEDPVIYATAPGS